MSKNTGDTRVAVLRQVSDRLLSPFGKFVGHGFIRPNGQTWSQAGLLTKRDLGSDRLCYVSEDNNLLVPTQK